jgi:integrase
MARAVRHTNLETRAARNRLPARSEPYWCAIGKGAHLGYYTGARGGSWLARLYLDGTYAKTAIGKADDTLNADGPEVLDYWQAQKKARDWFADQARRAHGLGCAAGPYTVAMAMDDYLAAYRQQRKNAAAVTAAIDAHIRPELGHIDAAKLTTAAIRQWHERIAGSAPRVRARAGAKPSFRAAALDDEGRRRRRATANRVLTNLKAALNHAWQDGKIQHDDAWRRVRAFRNADAPVVRYLQDTECVRLVNACGTSFRQIVSGALLTGCRYGELARLTVADYNPDSKTLAIRVSKSGKARHVVLTDEGAALFTELCAGRPGFEPVFKRHDGGRWGKSHQHRPLQEACLAAGIEPAISFHILRHTYASRLARSGVEMRVIADQLGHADTRMTERHYAHLAPSYVAQTVRAKFANLGIVESKIVPLPLRATAGT